MAFKSFFLGCVCFLLLTVFPPQTHAELSQEDLANIKRVNARGDHDCLIVTEESELKATLSRTFEPYRDLPFLDIANRRFHIGNMAGRRAIVVMSGSGPLNAARAAQMIVNLFRVRAVLHYGTAGNANPEKLNIGDVAVPTQFAECGYWYWEKFGGDEGNYDRDVAKLTISEYNAKKDVANKLEGIQLQRSSTYQAPEKEERKIFIGVDRELYKSVQKIEDMKLPRCMKEKPAEVCLAQQPKIKLVGSGCSGFVHVNNEAFRDFLRRNLKISTIDNASMAIASVCYSVKKPFIAFRSITHFAGGSPPENDAQVIRDLWPEHFHAVMNGFLNVMPNQDSEIRSVTGSEIW